jgi:uncharacterized damage-inducible protein DinB
MNRIMESYYPVFEMYQALRGQLMESLEDEDLAYSPGGENPSLGTLCKEIGEVERAYIDSFKTFEMDLSYRNPEPGLADSVAKLQAWYAALDEELKATVAALSEETLEERQIYRGLNFSVPLHIQLDIYKEALLIFYGKVSVYLKAMGRVPSEQWQEWIA